MILFSVVGILKSKYLLLVIWVMLISWCNHKFMLGGIGTIPVFWLYGCFFVAGMLFAIINFKMTFTVIAGIFLTVVVCMIFSQYFFLFSLLCPLLVLLFAFNPLPLILGVGKFGDYSYSIYLYAFPIQQLVIFSTNEKYSFDTLLFLSLALIFICAFFSWHTVEKRALKIKVFLKK